MINKEEITYKMDIVIEFLKKNKGYEYKLYNQICPVCPDEKSTPDSNIVEYAEGVKEMINELINSIEITEKDLPF